MEANGIDPFSRATTFPNELYRHLASGDIGPSDFLVAVTLEKFAFGDRRSCSPAIATLVNLTGLSERSVQLALKHLESVGIITRRLGAGRGHATEYALTGDKLGVATTTERAQNGATGCAITGPKGATGCTVLPTKGAKYGEKRRRIQQEKAQPVAPESTKESTKESHTEKTVECEMDSKPKSTTSTETFNSGFHFNEQAPARRIVDRFNREVQPGTIVVEPARRVVVKLLVDHPLVTEGALANAVSCYAAKVADKQARFRKSALSFFSDGHWQDYADQPSSPTNADIEAEAHARSRETQRKIAEAERNRASPAKLEKLNYGR